MQTTTGVQWKDVSVVSQYTPFECLGLSAASKRLRQKKNTFRLDVSVVFGRHDMQLDVPHDPTIRSRLGFGPPPERLQVSFGVSYADLRFTLVGMTAPVDRRSHVTPLDVDGKVRETTSEADSIAEGAVDDVEFDAELKLTGPALRGRAKSSLSEKVDRTTTTERIVDRERVTVREIGKDGSPRWLIKSNLGDVFLEHFKCHAEIVLFDEARDSAIEVRTTASDVHVTVTDLKDPKDLAIVTARAKKTLINKHLPDVVLYRGTLRPRTE